MKSAVQTISYESSRPDPDLAIVPAANIVIELPQPSQPPIGVHNGQTIQWRWDNNFSVSFTSGVFEPQSVNAFEQPDGSYLTVPPLRVIGPPRKKSTCTYTSLPNPSAANTDIDPPPPPPPNVVIVDNSIFPWAGEK